VWHESPAPKGNQVVIKPIETEYQGYLFRSRLEARWAVFFDALELGWEYELEGFDLGNGDLYLPDFWLPDVNMWAEVKGRELSSDERRKCELLVKGSGHPCLMLIGTPENKPYKAIEINWDPSKGIDLYEVPYCLTNFHEYPKEEGRFYCWPAAGERYWDDTEEAVKAARSARFEWGQSP
jgi:hypothetical protein